MSWRMPAETFPHARTWMAFPRQGFTLGDTFTQREAGYQAWTDVAHAVAEYEPVVMVVDPSETKRARRMLSGETEILEAPIDEYWMRDAGPTFVLSQDDPGILGAVDWTFNGWGDHSWAQWEKASQLAQVVANACGAQRIESGLVNEGGGIHVDGEGTVLLTETVQRDPRRNPGISHREVEAEMLRTIGASHAVWLPRGLTRDYDQFGTSGHVDIVATIPSPGTLLLHAQENQSHPDYRVSTELKHFLEQHSDAAGNPFTIVPLPAPDTIRDDVGYVDWSYVNHLVVNGGVVACGFGEQRSDDRARSVLSEVYPGRTITMVDARELFARGGGVHCITQQQPQGRTASSTS